MAYTPSAHWAGVDRLTSEIDLSFGRLNRRTSLVQNTLFFHLLWTKWIHSVYVLPTEWHAEEEKRVWWYLCLNPKLTTPADWEVGRQLLGNRVLWCHPYSNDEKFKLTSELFAGTAAWDIYVLWDIWIRAGSPTLSESTQWHKLHTQ